MAAVEYPLDQAMQSTLAVVAKVGPGDLGAPTPCASWDVRALVNHVIGTARWWAAMIAGDDGGADDQFTHGWDLARAIGYPADLDPALASALLIQARIAITDALRGPDGAALFGPAAAVPDGAGPADQLAAFPSSPPSSAARCEPCPIARRSSPPPRGSGVSCSRTAIACSGR
jgi:hypothetical protein